MVQRRRRAKSAPSIGGASNATSGKGHPYRQISYLLEPQNLYSQDKIAAIHEAALRGCGAHRKRFGRSLFGKLSA